MRSRALRIAACALILPASWGCLTSTQATRLQTDLDEVKRQLFRMQQDTAGSQERLASIDRRLESGSLASTGGQADLNATIQTLLDQVQILNRRIEETQSRIATLHQEIQALRQPGGPRPPAGVAGSFPVAPPAAPAGEQTEAFHAAYSDYNKGNYELAVMGFSDFLRANPDHPLGPDAQYWIGECYFSQGRYSDAAEAFDRTVRRWPESAKAPAALLKKGLSQMEMGQTSRAVPTLQQVIEDHPQSEEARIAAARLQQLGLRP